MPSSINASLPACEHGKKIHQASTDNPGDKNVRKKWRNTMALLKKKRNCLLKQNPAENEEFAQKNDFSKITRQFPREILIHGTSVSSNEAENVEEIFSIDPIYLALKKANEMSSNRRQSGSLASKNNSFCASPAAMTPPPFVDGSFILCPGSHKDNAQSTPNLAESTDRPRVPSSKIHRHTKKSSVRRRAPKLDLKMKSLSLDCTEISKFLHQAKYGTEFSMPNKHTIRVPTLSDSNSCEESATDFFGSFLCHHKRCEAVNILPNPLFAVAHDYCAKFAQEIDIRVGELVLVLETKDNFWWKGQNASGKIGIFPSTSVAHVHTNEKIMQVLQNVNLIDSTKNLRLYRDQVVFVPVDQSKMSHFTVIRTERDHRINCPTNYLYCLE